MSTNGEIENSKTLGREPSFSMKTNGPATGFNRNSLSSLINKLAIKVEREDQVEDCAVTVTSPYFQKNKNEIKEANTL